uniref:PUM-HD domain-containing protein n=1 Tax=Aegilops tauschii subsp. strangulata TaxID=200361 RepID=A0A453KQ61_AEGTS
MLFIRMECPSCKVVWSMSDGQKRIMFCQKSLVAAPILLKIVLGNYIVQYVLKQRNPSYLAIIASHFRSNYVTLSRQRYSSNVVETCLQVFNDRDRSNIVHELIRYHPFRDLVSDEFANYVISRALTTCKGSSSGSIGHCYPFPSKCQSPSPSLSEDVQHTFRAWLQILKRK